MDPQAPSSYPVTPPLHVAVVEDNVELRQHLLLPALRKYGFRAHGAASAADLYRIMLAQRFDIIVLDVGLPDEDGYTVAQHLRATSEIGIVMLTGREGRRHHLEALNRGADFFLTKPVDLDVLAATLHSLGRRLISRQVRDTAVDPLQPARWRLEAGGWRLVSPQGKVLDLTAPEQCVAATLAASHGAPVSRDALISALTRNIYDFDPHRLEMMIHRWRKKAFTNTGEALPLITVRGNGYLLTCDSDLPFLLSS